MAELKIKTPDGNNHVSLTTANASGNATVTLPKADIDLTGGSNGQYLKTNGSGTLSWGTVSTDPTTTSGTNNFTVADGNLVVATAGHGIDFSATADTSASGAAMSNELLDDYEEGTWTPYIFGWSSAGTGTYPGTSTWGKYTRVGNVVHCIFNLYSSAHTGSGGTYLGGMPYTALGCNTHYDIPLGGESLNCGSGKVPRGHIHQGDVKARVLKIDYNGGDASFLDIENGNMYLSGSFSYLAS